jgi:hypothetical protein
MNAGASRSNPMAPSEPVFVAISLEGSDPLSRSMIGTPNGWDASAFTQGNDLPWNAQTLLGCQCAMGTCPGECALRSYSSLENPCSIPSCHTPVKSVYYSHEQTNDCALHATRQTIDPTSEGALRVSIRYCRYSFGVEDGSARGGSPLPCSKQGTALTPPVLKHGVLRAD